MTRKSRKPQRTCLGCRQVYDQKSLARLVRSSEGLIVVDQRNRLPGRGAYVCWERRCLEKVTQKQFLDKAFRQECQPITLDELLIQIKDKLLGHMASLIGMARKSAQLVAGANAVHEALGWPERIGLLVLAIDAPDALVVKTKQKSESTEKICDDLFAKKDLGRILGRTEYSVIGIYRGQLAEAFVADLHKFRNLSGEN